jgi:hypothetical protein
MKGRFFLILLAVLLLTGCVLRPVSFTLDESGSYTGFRSMEEGYTRRAAKLYGWVVLEELAIKANGRNWQRFLKRSAGGKNGNVRIAEFFGDEMALIDVFYEDGQYRAFFSDGFDMRDEPFALLLTLTGTVNGQNTYVVVLTGDDSLTYEEVMHKFFSSQYPVSDIPAHRVLFLGTGEPDW